MRNSTISFLSFLSVWICNVCCRIFYSLIYVSVDLDKFMAALEKEEKSIVDPA